MELSKAMFVPHKTIQEQILERLSATLPEDGPYVVLVDQRGNAIAGHSPRFNRTLESCKIVDQACMRLADGCDPSWFQIDGAYVICTQLYTDYTDYGNLMMVFPGYTSHWAQANMDVIEILINQANLIASLVEANAHLKVPYSGHSHGDRQTAMV